MIGFAMDFETVLPEYSDRIAQDSHLIPSSRHGQALDTAFIAHTNYTIFEDQRQ